MPVGLRLEIVRASAQQRSEFRRNWSAEAMVKMVANSGDGDGATWT